MKQPFGQNFLFDKATALCIVNSLNLTESDTVLEIGPGKGILTEFLLTKARHVFAVELDRDLASILTNKFSNYKLHNSQSQFSYIYIYRLNIFFVNSVLFVNLSAHGCCKSAVHHFIILKNL